MFERGNVPNRCARQAVAVGALEAALVGFSAAAAPVAFQVAVFSQLLTSGSPVQPDHLNLGVPVAIR